MNFLQQNFLQNFNFAYGLSFFLLAAWSFFWKGLALWNAAKTGAKYWFIAILILNTFGILEIIYLFFYSRQKLNFSQVMDKLKGWRKRNSKATGK